MASAGTPDFVAGAVVLWGRVEVHESGMRAEYARIVGLEQPLTSGGKRRQLETVAAQLSVPVVPHSRLVAVAMAHGLPLDPCLRPAPSGTSGSAESLEMAPIAAALLIVLVGYGPRRGRAEDIRADPPEPTRSSRRGRPGTRMQRRQNGAIAYATKAVGRGQPARTGARRDDPYGMREEERGPAALAFRSPSIAAATLAPSVPAAAGASPRARPIKYAIMKTSPAPVVCTSATT
jgi:hypothetical protein